MSEHDGEALIFGSTGDPFPAIGQKRRRGVRVTSAAAIALGLAISGGAVAGATTSSSASTPSASAATTGALPVVLLEHRFAVGFLQSAADALL